MDELLARCACCPRECKVDRLAGETGVCGVSGREVLVSKVMLHRWEEPCISGKRGAGNVFFSGCSLRCRFCQNHQISFSPKGIKVSVSKLVELFFALVDQGAQTLNLVTPTHYLPQIIEALHLAKKEGLSVPVVYNTGGYEKAEMIRRLDGLVDVYLPDIKYFSREKGAFFAKAPDYFEQAMKAAKEMVRQTGQASFTEDGILKRGVIFRYLLLPGELSEGKDILDALYSRFQNRVYYSLMSQYTPPSFLREDPVLSRRVLKEEYEELVSFAWMLGIQNGFTQEFSSATEEYLPDFTDPGF